MTNLTITNSELKRLLKGFAFVYVGCVTLFALALWRCFDANPGPAVFRSLSPALVVASVLFSLFVGWAWRFRIVAKWMGRPVLQGVWLGYLNSDYKPTSATTSVAKPIVFVIRQTYLTLSIQSFTDTQVGESTVEAVIRNERTEATRVAYVFELKSLYPGERKITSGAGNLQLLSTDSQLRGDYWTSSPTRGSLILRLQSRTIDNIDSFDAAKSRWPIGPLWRA
jgi:hypothetical protein